MVILMTASKTVDQEIVMETTLEMDENWTKNIRNPESTTELSTEPNPAEDAEAEISAGTLSEDKDDPAWRDIGYGVKNRV